MASLFVGNSEIDAGPAPFRAMWSNPPSSCSKLGQQMRELMPNRPIDLCFPVMNQKRVKRNQPGLVIGAAGAAFQTFVPNNPNLPGQPQCSIDAEKPGGLMFQIRVPSVR
jgi:hypothetical protein